MERPMHGYEMMKALGERSGGTYTPSPGSVYPTLQMLEDRGFVTASDVEGKKVYSITEGGRGFLSENQSGEGPRPGRRGFWGVSEDDWADFAAVWHELRALGPVARRAMHQVRHDPRQLPRLRRLIDLVRVELEKIARGADEFDA